MSFPITYSDGNFETDTFIDESSNTLTDEDGNILTETGFICQFQLVIDNNETWRI